MMEAKRAKLKEMEPEDKEVIEDIEKEEDFFKDLDEQEKEPEEDFYRRKISSRILKKSPDKVHRNT
jgi:hypothetical protein